MDPSSGKAGQPWTRDAAPTGVTCPACGLANEPGARVCRNCGLPIASAVDPLRGVMPGQVDLPTVRRSGISNAIGLALVVGLLLVGGSLAISGGGILSSGGRIGLAPGETATAAPLGGDPGQTQDPGTTPGVPASGEPTGALTASGTSFDYTCENAAIKDLSSGKWRLSQYRVGLREEGATQGEEATAGVTFERITWEMSRRGKARDGATTVTMEWTTPKEAKAEYGSRLVIGKRAIMVTFDGPVDLTVGQQIDELLLEPEGVTQVRSVDMFEGEDGKVRTVIGIRGDSCARMSANGWGKKDTGRAGRVFLDVERF